MGTAILKSAAAGVVGDVTRKLDSVIEPIMLGSAFSAFGVPAKINGSGKLVPIAASDAATVFKGILTRSVPSMGGNTNQGFDDVIPNAEACHGLLVKGYVNVKCAIGTPVRGGIVYMRVVAASGKLVGDLEATADGTDNVALSGVEWAVNGKDADNITELKIK